MHRPNPHQSDVLTSLENIDASRIRGVLLDIEGTTSSISFVHDVMFPYALDHLDAFLNQHFSRDDVAAACQQVAKDAGHASLSEWQLTEPDLTEQQLVSEEIKRLVAADAKATGLKALQGLIWQGGFESGTLKAHIFPDVLPAIHRWKAAGLDVRIYSSGSIAAQKLFFGHLDTSEFAPNQLHVLSGHYDTTYGGKKETESYQRIANHWGLSPDQILFISDIADELVAASNAGIQVLASVRPGNKPLPSDLPVASIQTMDAVLA
ncbi:MAG TPA: acireductone synthase [Planctomycetaceae bacterium]|nr:acireductone synthase [Planctomycetaceae bacterium]